MKFFTIKKLGIAAIFSFLLISFVELSFLWIYTNNSEHERFAFIFFTAIFTILHLFYCVVTEEEEK